MTQALRPQARAALIWAAVGAAIVVPVVAATQSPLLAWRQPVYIVAGLAGVVTLPLLLLQPLLAADRLPGLGRLRALRLHRLMGALLVGAVVVHVAGLWITSPPDVIDALLLRSPTPFSAWGVMAMWGVFVAAALAVMRRKPPLWYLAHRAVAMLIVLGGVVHAWLIQGTMEPITKAILGGLVLLATLIVAAGPGIRWLARAATRSSRSRPDRDRSQG